MNKQNELMVTRIKAQAFDAVVEIVTGKRAVDTDELIKKVNEDKQMLDFILKAVEQGEAERAD